MKNNDRLQRVQVGREKEVPLDSNNKLWFLVIKNDGDWDSENSLDCFKEDLEKGYIKSIFCIWHGEYRTNLFLMPNNFILNYLNKK